MPRVGFSEMPETGRVWVFGVGRALAPSEERELLRVVDQFLDSWATHGTPLRCARDFRHGRFLFIAVDDDSVPPSGCSIDAVAHVLKAAEARFSTPIVDHTAVWFLDDDGVHRVDRTEFGALARTGRVSRHTTVFDNTITRVSQLNGGEWECPAEAAWHGRAFFRS